MLLFVSKLYCHLTCLAFLSISPDLGPFSVLKSQLGDMLPAFRDHGASPWRSDS